MDSRKLSTLLCSFVSQLLLLLLLLFDSSLTSDDFASNAVLFPIVNYFLSSQEIAASLSLLSLPRKRKRAHLLHSDAVPAGEDGDDDRGRRLTRNPDSYKTVFKMSASTFEWLSGLLEPLLECRDPVGSPLNLSAELRLGIGLSRLSTGSSYLDIAQQFGVPESVARFCAKHLCRVLCTNFRFWLAFPGPDDLKSVSHSFEELTGLPNCCGVIACARFSLVKEADEYSITAQIVVDSSARILSIAAGFRGNKSDSMILESSTLYKDIEAGRILSSTPINVNGAAVNEYLIGDGQYPLLPWLMVPFLDSVPGSAEEKFNVAHSSMRVPALRTIACLKHWGALKRPMKEELKTAVAMIGACSILHNVLLMREDDSGLCEVVGDYSAYDQKHAYFGGINLEESSTERKAAAIRNALAASLGGDTSGLHSFQAHVR